MSNNWYDSNNPSTVARGATWRSMVWVLAVVLFFALIGGAFWAFSVATAPVKGAGDAYKQKESAANRINSQAMFEDLNADFEATIGKIKIAKQAAKAAPNSQIKATELTGLQNYCVDVAGDYNAESRKYLAADFKAIDLPFTLDAARCSI